MICLFVQIFDTADTILGRSLPEKWTQGIVWSRKFSAGHRHETTETELVSLGWVILPGRGMPIRIWLKFFEYSLEWDLDFSTICNCHYYHFVDKCITRPGYTSAVYLILQITTIIFINFQYLKLFGGIMMSLHALFLLFKWYLSDCWYGLGILHCCAKF